MEGLLSLGKARTITFRGCVIDLIIVEGVKSSIGVFWREFKGIAD